MDMWVIRIVEMDRSFYAGSLQTAEKVVTHNLALATRFKTFADATTMRSNLSPLFPTARYILIDPIQVIR